MHMKSFYLTGTMLSAIVGEKTGGNAMFGKFQDSLLFVVLAIDLPQSLPQQGARIEIRFITSIRQNITSAPHRGSKN